MDKNLWNVILSVGLSGFVFLALFIGIDWYFSLGIGNIAFLGMIMMIIGWITVRLALKRGRLQRPLKIMETVKIGALSGLVAVIPFLLFGCFQLFNPGIGNLNLLVAMLVFLPAGVGVLMSAFGGGLGVFGANKPPHSSHD